MVLGLGLGCSPGGAPSFPPLSASFPPLSALPFLVAGSARFSPGRAEAVAASSALSSGLARPLLRRPEVLCAELSDARAAGGGEEEAAEPAPLGSAGSVVAELVVGPPGAMSAAAGAGAVVVAAAVGAGAREGWGRRPSASASASVGASWLGLELGLDQP